MILKETTRRNQTSKIHHGALGIKENKALKRISSSKMNAEILGISKMSVPRTTYTMMKKKKKTKIKPSAPSCKKTIRYKPKLLKMNIMNFLLTLMPYLININS